MGVAKVLGLLVVVGLVVAGAARPADACGSWTMQDVEKQHHVYYLVNSGVISKLGKDGKPGKRIASQYFDSEHKPGLRVMKGKQVAMDIKGNKVVRAGKTVGTIGTDGSVTFGKHVYTFEFGKPVDHPLPSWELVVKRGDTTVSQTERASAMCMHGGGLDNLPVDTATEAKQQDEIRRRVIFYLAWRHAGG